MLVGLGVDVVAGGGVDVVAGAAEVLGVDGLEDDFHDGNEYEAGAAFSSAADEGTAAACTAAEVAEA